MFPEPMKDPPKGYDTKQDMLDAIALFIAYLACLLAKGASKGSPEASACFAAYCLGFDDRFPV